MLCSCTNFVPRILPFDHRPHVLVCSLLVRRLRHAGIAQSRAHRRTEAKCCFLNINRTLFSSGIEPSGMALGPSGDAYIQGTTASSDFPVVNTLQPANAGGLDAFVARIRPTTVSDRGEERSNDNSEVPLRHMAFCQACSLRPIMQRETAQDTGQA